MNKSGKFNVPEGSYKKPDICNSERLRKASKALIRAQIQLGDFGRVVQPDAEDLIYCDPALRWHIHRLSGGGLFW